MNDDSDWQLLALATGILLGLLALPLTLIKIGNRRLVDHLKEFWRRNWWLRLVVAGVVLLLVLYWSMRPESWPLRFTPTRR